jgi:integrase
VFAALKELHGRGKRVKAMPVFPSVKSARPAEHMTAHGLNARFSEFKRMNGLPQNVVLYSARHTFATDVTEATGDITKTQKALGDTQLKTTMRYVHARAADAGASWTPVMKKGTIFVRVHIQCNKALGPKHRRDLR